MKGLLIGPWQALKHGQGGYFNGQLYGQYCSHSLAERDLTSLHDVIKRLMDASAAEDDENMRVLYATVESAARKARQYILRCGGMKN